MREPRGAAAGRGRGGAVARRVRAARARARLAAVRHRPQVLLVPIETFRHTHYLKTISGKILSHISGNLIMHVCNY